VSGGGAGGALDRITRLRGVRWQWREDAPAEARVRVGMGVIAQEVEAVFPELVVAERGVKRVRYRGLVSPLMAAVGELDARVAALATIMEEGMSSPTPERQSERVAAASTGEVRTELDPDAVARVFPELVVTNDRGERVVAYEGLIGQLIEAVKELDARVRALESAPR
jgi:Chaperone of endosialidase